VGRGGFPRPQSPRVRRLQCDEIWGLCWREDEEHKRGKGFWWSKRDCSWIAHTELPRTVAHPFYEQLNRVLEARGFDEFVEQQCSHFYAEKMGRPAS
jgi:hypothetical protein